VRTMSDRRRGGDRRKSRSFNICRCKTTACSCPVYDPVPQRRHDDDLNDIKYFGWSGEVKWPRASGD